MDERISRWPLVGRDSELKAFTAAWANRRCQGLMIYGQAGVGKSRLAEECLARAVHDGWKGRRATASKAVATVPLGAIAHLIPAGVDLSDPVKGFAAVASALTGPDRRRRWALWVDDLHLLDATSAVLLRQLLDAGVVRLIATVRTGEPVGEAVQALTGGDAVHRIDLTTFSPQQLETVLQAALGGPVGRRTLHELCTASGGNVLYLHELVLGALQAGALASDGEIWELTRDRPQGTPKLTELIEARLVTVGPTARPVLELLALCEPLPLADAQAAASLRVLVDLEEAGLLQVTTDRHRTTIALTHPLYREILRAGLPVLRGRTLLLAQAERVEASGARRRDDALHIATWRLAATGTADAALLLQAAVLARHAHDYQQTFDLLQALPDTARTTATHLMQGEALFEMGKNDQAEAILAAADARTVDEAAKLLVTNLRMTNLFWGAGRTAEALAVRQAAEAQVTSAGGLSMLLTLEGVVRVGSGDFVRGLNSLEGLGEARQAPDVNTWLHGASLKTMGLALTGRTTAAVRWAGHAHEANLCLDEQALRPPPATQLAPMVVALAEAGRLTEARDIGEHAYAELLAANAPIPELWTALFLARAESMAGHYARARHWYAESAALCRARNQTRALRPVLAGLAATTAILGDVQIAEAAQVKAKVYPQVGYFPTEECLGTAWVQAGRGHLAKARARLTKAAETARSIGHVASEALLLTDAARLGGAREVTGRLNELAQLCDGAFAPARAHLAAALAADAPDRLLAAADELETIGADLLAAEAATAAAAAWRRTGRARRAASATQRAQVCATRCKGAHTPLLATAEAASALTPREREIALLAAADISSKDIADALHLSVRTIDNHLQHAYAKLGVTTRRELANTLGQPITRPPTMPPNGVVTLADGVG
ncbi:LuxR C-terminal-related transcriptional regulator [Streptomyces sp. NBC_00289]|uniref:helix-turn-helix transcriptional regulator n=1 Tax=Streptomyces sp. NBC_00289 TaxID=2975703 RepID=UPI003255922E